MKRRWDYIKLVCGECGAPLKLENGQWGPFFGCINYPNCFNRFTANVYEELLDQIYNHVIQHQTAKGFKTKISRSRLKLVAEVTHETPKQVTVSAVNLAQKAYHQAIKRETP